METVSFAHQIHADHQSPVHTSAMLTHFLIPSQQRNDNFLRPINLLTENVITLLLVRLTVVLNFWNVGRNRRSGWKTMRSQGERANSGLNLDVWRCKAEFHQLCHWDHHWEITCIALICMPLILLQIIS